MPAITVKDIFVFSFTRPSPAHVAHFLFGIVPVPAQVEHWRTCTELPKNPRRVSRTSPWPLQVAHWVVPAFWSLPRPAQSLHAAKRLVGIVFATPLKASSKVIETVNSKSAPRSRS